MLFFNNLRMMHARTAYLDGNEKDGTSMRYMLRLILKDLENNAWQEPHELAGTWEELYDHADEEELVSIKAELFSYTASH
jgi:hypothetical protein